MRPRLQSGACARPLSFTVRRQRGHAVMRITSFTSLLALALAFPSASRSGGAVDVTVCQLLADPPAYNHKLVRITGQISFAFEEFTLNAEHCQGRTGPIWLEYGGTVKSGAIPQGRPRTRKQPLVIDGITTTLVKDSTFETFDASLHQPPAASLNATLMGTYFAGKPGAFANNEWGGFGHFGMYSLLVIQQVISFEAR
jgi:hypothetical protein